DHSAGCKTHMRFSSPIPLVIPGWSEGPDPRRAIAPWESRDSGSPLRDARNDVSLSTERRRTPTMKLSRRIAVPRQIRIANRGALTDTGLPQPSISPHGPHTIQIPGRAVDGRLALLDADHHGRRPRGGARDQRVPAHGDAVDP